MSVCLDAHNMLKIFIFSTYFLCSVMVKYKKFRMIMEEFW